MLWGLIFLERRAFPSQSVKQDTKQPSHELSLGPILRLRHQPTHLYTIEDAHLVHQYGVYHAIPGTETVRLTVSKATGPTVIRGYITCSANGC